MNSSERMFQMRSDRKPQNPIQIQRINGNSTGWMVEQREMKWVFITKWLIKVGRVIQKKKNQNEPKPNQPTNRMKKE